MNIDHGISNSQESGGRYCHDDIKASQPSGHVRNQLISRDSYGKRLPMKDATEKATHNDGQFGVLCESPNSSDAEDSMNHYSENFTPEEALIQADSPGVTGHTTEALGRLSFEHRRTISREHLPSQRGRGLYTECHPLASKRSASHELTKPGGRQSPRLVDSPKKAANTCAARSRVSRRGCVGRTTSHDFTSAVTDPRVHAKYLPGACNNIKAPHHKDSGYESQKPSRYGTAEYCEGGDVSIHTPAVPTKACISSQKQHIANAERRMARQTSITGEKWNIVLQPDSSPISTEQLALEVKGIYAGLVMVEAKCINIDAAQAADPKSPLGAEQWQALIALHRTLLYEHHDFLMATQHPSATPALRGLANKYSMPARMWKHGIHAFLEVLRHRRPQSQEYMLAFIYLAYQMMALLFETVPSFTDTWIECLGDLARYRMAIEEEKEAHATWGGVAARWYTMASDRHPAIGRLYHHLGILERPSLRKFCLYSKSLTCALQFCNARDSLSTLCAPIVLDEQTIQSSRQSAEARIVTYHALVVARRDPDTINTVGQDSLQLLTEQPTKLREFGAYFASTNIASLFELGAATNTLWVLYNAIVTQAIPGTQPSTATSVNRSNITLATTHSEITANPYLQSTNVYFADSFNFVLQQYDSPGSIKDALSFVHVSLVCLHSLHALRTRISQGHPHTPSIPFDFGRLSFSALASFLTTLAQQETITTHMLERARQGVFLGSELPENAKPLSEDYIIRGHIWSQFYFSPEWFDCQSEDDGRAIETANMMKARSARVLWLGLVLAFHTDHLSFDVKTQIFSAATATESASELLTEQSAESAHPVAVDLASMPADRTSVFVAPPSAETTSSDGSEEDGFMMVSQRAQSSSSSRIARHQSYPPAAADFQTSERVLDLAKSNKKQQDLNAFQIVDENGNTTGEDDSEFLGAR